MASFWENLAYDTFSWYKYLIVNLVFSHLGFRSENLFLIAPFPDRCVLVPFYRFSAQSLSVSGSCCVNRIEYLLHSP